MLSKKILTSAMIVCLFSSNITAYAGQMLNMRLMYDGKMHDYKAKEIYIEIDGNPLQKTDMPPVVIQDRTLVPVRAISEALDAEVAWNAELREVYINKEDNIVVLQVGNEKGSRNGSQFTMDVPAKIINDRTMIPVRAVSEALDCNVKWNGDTRTVSILSKEEVPKEDTPEETENNNQQGNSEQSRLAITELIRPSLGNNQYKIQTNGKIEQFEDVYVDDMRIVLDIYGAENRLEANISVEDNPYVVGIRTAQHQVDKSIVTRVVFDLKNPRKYVVRLTEDNTGLLIDFLGADVDQSQKEETNQNNNPINNQTNKENSFDIENSTLKNMSYDFMTQTLTLDKDKNISIHELEHLDNYLIKNYKITLPGDYESSYGYGKYLINDGFLDSVNVSTTNGRTTLTFQEKKILAYTITEDDNHYYIRAQNPKQVYDKIVVLDAGHGGNDPGTNGNGFNEKDLVLKILQKTYEKCKQNQDFKVYITRIDDSRPANADRAAMANEIGDVFISIHLNSADTAKQKNPLPNGTETLYKDHATDVPGKLTSKLVASIMQKHMLAKLGTNDRGLKYRDDLLVLNVTQVPAIIVETAFLSNAGDAFKISQDQYQELAAQAIYDAIVEMMNYRLR